MIDKSNFNLLKYNTFGIEAKCNRFIELCSAEEAISILPSIYGTNFLLLGGGSNVLFNSDYSGTVIHSAIKGIEVNVSDNDIYLRFGSGENWDKFVEYCVDNQYYGTENLSLIPGDVGASAVQNIGAYGSEVKDIIYQVEAIEIESGKLVKFENSDCEYSYRHSRFKADWKNKYFITYVTYKLSRQFNPNIDYGNIRKALEAKSITNPSAQELREVIIGIRQEKLPDPEIIGNAGSFFMNPIVTREKFESLLSIFPDMPHYKVDETREKIPAGWMIDKCGWKGKSLGNAGVHDKQALVLVNRGGATGKDIVKLCQTIQKDVLAKFGIEIKPEVNII